MFANKHAKILIALVCAVLGFMLATQFKTTERQKTINIQRAEDLSDRLKAVEKERDELSKEMEKLQAKAGDEVVAREIVRLKAFAGDFEMHGKGIKLVLDDSKIASKPGENPNLYIIHAAAQFAGRHRRIQTPHLARTGGTAGGGALRHRRGTLAPDRPDAVRRLPESPSGDESRRTRRHGGQRPRNRRATAPRHET